MYAIFIYIERVNFSSELSELFSFKNRFDRGVNHGHLREPVKFCIMPTASDAMLRTNDGYIVKDSYNLG